MKERNSWRGFRELGRQLLRSVVPEKPPALHPVVWRGQMTNAGLEAVEIAPEVDIPVFSSGVDRGYHGFSNEWWTNTRCPYAFQYPNIDSMYAGSYYSQTETGHPDSSIAEDLYGYMQRVYTAVFGKEFRSILELGTGGGEITRAFWANHLDLVAVEGTAEGVERLKQLGVPTDRIVHENLKRLRRLDRSFDLVMCTEVAEHIEPWFSSKVAENCVLHGDAVWFSAADRNRRAHYHHINEVDIAAWDNLFAHMGFPLAVRLDGRHGRASRLYVSRSAAAAVRSRAISLSTARDSK